MYFYFIKFFLGYFVVDSLVKVSELKFVNYYFGIFNFFSIILFVILFVFEKEYIYEKR